MENSLDILFLLLAFSIFLHTMAGVIVLAFVIPLQVREAGVKNGLASLRRQMLAKGIISLLVVVVSIIVLTIRFLTDNVEFLRYAYGFLIFLHALGILAKAIIDFKVYHQQYTPENKELHAKVEALENRRKSNYK